MFDWSTPAASIIVVVSAFFALMRWNPPEWWKRIGFWFWRQEIGPQQVLGWTACWKRVVPRSFAKWVQKLFLTDKEYEEHAAKQEAALAARLDRPEVVEYSLDEVVTQGEMQISHERRFTHLMFCNGNTPVTDRLFGNGNAPVTVAVVGLLVWVLIVLSTSLAS